MPFSGRVLEFGSDWRQLGSNSSWILEKLECFVFLVRATWEPPFDALRREALRVQIVAIADSNSAVQGKKMCAARVPRLCCVVH